MERTFTTKTGGAVGFSGEGNARKFQRKKTFKRKKKGHLLSKEKTNLLRRLRKGARKEKRTQPYTGEKLSTKKESLALL